MNTQIANTIEHGWQSLIAAIVAIAASLIMAWILTRLFRALFRFAPWLEGKAVLLPMRTLVFSLVSCSSNLPILQIQYMIAYGLGGHWGLISITLILTVLGTWFFARLFLGLQFQQNNFMQGFGIARTIFIAAIWVGFSAGKMTGSGSQLARDSFKSIMQFAPSHAVNAAVSGLILSVTFDVVLGAFGVYLSQKIEKKNGEPLAGENAPRPTA